MVYIRCWASRLQTLAGHYKLDNPRVNVEVWVVPQTGTSCYYGFVLGDGVLLEPESMLLCPIRTGYLWTNARSNSGTAHQTRGGDLEVEVGTGPNAGKKTTWKR